MTERSSEVQKDFLETKLVFPNDVVARYIFFALKNDLGGLEGCRLGFKEFVILVDTYFDTPDLSFSRKGETRRFREEWSGSAPSFRKDLKRRSIFKEESLSYQKIEVLSDQDEVPASVTAKGERLSPVAKIQNFRMIIAVLSEKNRPLGLMHCDQSAVLGADDVVSRQFYEIELHYPKKADHAVPMERFSEILQKTFNLSVINRSKLERALDITFEGGEA